MCPSLPKDPTTIPYSFSVSRGGSQFRELSVPHPKSQIETAELYERYKNQILYFTSRSNFSIRYPASVARYTLRVEDDGELNKENDQNGSVEDSQNSDTILRSYFRYHRYSNIHKFYDSPEYLSLESTYPVLMRLDITQCFSSIYTHSLAWAVVGKEQAKADRSSGFGNEFDGVMQRSNYGQTNGLLVGPESSRVFAEIILQEIDRRVEDNLAKRGLVVGRDFDIARYVDDYFVFSHSDAASQVIKSVISVELQQSSLRLNFGKESLISTPHITPISLAKAAIASAISRAFPIDRQTVLTLQTQSVHFRSDRTIFDYKAAVAGAGAEHADVVNFALAVVERRIASMSNQLDVMKVSRELDESFVQELLVGAVEVSSFLYGTSLRVATTIKICRILGRVVSMAEGLLTNRSRRDLVKETIASTLRRALGRPVSLGQPGIERLYLLTALHSLGRPWLMSCSDLEDILNGSTSVDGQNGGVSTVDYFTAIAVLHYVEGRHRYDRLRSDLIARCIARIESLPPNAAERAFLSIDLLACPYVPKEEKNAILDIHGVSLDPSVRAVMRRGVFSFTLWSKFDLQNQLELKRNSEAY
jgi:hypothetical protein